jgi:hypothetical protein
VIQIKLGPTQLYYFSNRFFFGEGNRLLGRPGRRYDDMRIDLGGLGWGGIDWIHLAEDRDRWGVLVNTVLNLRVP